MQVETVLFTINSLYTFHISITVQIKFAQNGELVHNTYVFSTQWQSDADKCLQTCKAILSGWTIGIISMLNDHRATLEDLNKVGTHVQYV